MPQTTGLFLAQQPGFIIITQLAGFMAPPINPAPERGGEEKITALPLSERRSFK